MDVMMGAGQWGHIERRTRFAMVATVLVALVLGAPRFALAQPASLRNFDIPAQPLAAALTAFGQQAGLQVSVPAELLGGRTSTAVKGRLSAATALERLLNGTGLIGRIGGPTVTLEPAPPPAGGAVQLGPVRVTGEDVPAPPEQPVGSRARGTSDPGATEGSPDYRVPGATTATKTDTPIIETPFTVQVIPQQALTDLGLTSSGLSDALAFQGVQSRGYAPSTEILIFRGFESTSTLWNGFRIEEQFSVNGEGNGGVWMDNVDRLEVMKGPSSILYGRAEPGGAVNVLTRKPQAEFSGQVQTGIGSWSNPWLRLDLTGSLNARKTLRYRLNVAGERADSYFTYGTHYRSRGVAPSLEWEITPRTTLSFEGQYRALTGGNGQSYIPIDPASHLPISVKRSATWPRDTGSEYRQYRTMLGLSHRFNADWAMSWKILHDSVDSPAINYIFIGAPQFPISPSGMLTVSRNAITSQSNTNLTATVLDVTGRVTALGIKHTLMFGGEYYDYRNLGRQGYDFDRNPAYSTDYFNQASFPWNAIAITDDYRINRHSPAAYAQDQMALPGNWHLLLGARLQRLEESVSYLGDNEYDKSVVQPRVGLLWRPRPWISTYYSYSENGGVSNGFAFPGIALRPESSRQHEAGAKTDWFGGRLSATAALFGITKYDVASADPDHPGFNIAVGEVQSTGYEVGIQGALTRNWNVLANLTYAPPKITKSADGANGPESKSMQEGQFLPFVSNRTFSLLTSYRLPWSSLERWSVGGGINAASATNPTAATTLPTAPYTGHAVASVFAAYSTRLGSHDAVLQMNVNNLFDEAYMLSFANSATVASGNYGLPRQFKLNLRVAF